MKGERIPQIPEEENRNSSEGDYEFTDLTDEQRAELRKELAKAIKQKQ